MLELREEKLNKLLRIVSIFAIIFCCILLPSQVRNFIIETGEKVIGRNLNNDIFNSFIELILIYSLTVFFCFIFILLATVNSIQDLLERHRKYRENIFIFFSIIILIISIIVRIVMYVKCRSLWIDEAMLADSIVARNWHELLRPPLSNNQSVPVLYVISVKLICSVLGYSEFSLRLFSLLSFIGLLVCERIFLKRALGCNNFQIAFVVAMTALLPAYIWYSNELKPYMSDAFFIILTILLHFYYTQNKIKLPTLTISYILILGFSSPAIFFVGGIFVLEFFIAVFNKNKKQIYIFLISGAIILTVFGLYYHWWMSPVSEAMKAYWGNRNKQYNIIIQLLFIFDPRAGSSNSSFVMFFVPFALLGIFSLNKSKNKMARSVVLSLLFVFLASVMGYWPMTGRLWLFLPAIVLVFTPIGIDFIHDKIKERKITNAIEFFLFSAIVIFLSLNCLGYVGDKMYFRRQEINPLINYVERNIKDDEKLYVYPFAKDTFNYKNGYATTKIGNVDDDNIIFGINPNEWNENILGNELRLILENEKTYLIFQHYQHYEVGIDKGLAVLRNYGILTEVMNAYGTPLYYFEKYVNSE